MISVKKKKLLLQNFLIIFSISINMAAYFYLLLLPCSILYMKIITQNSDISSQNITHTIALIKHKEAKVIKSLIATAAHNINVLGHSSAFQHKLHSARFKINYLSFFLLPCSLCAFKEETHWTHFCFCQVSSLQFFSPEDTSSTHGAGTLGMNFLPTFWKKKHYYFPQSICGLKMKYVFDRDIN